MFAEGVIVNLEEGFPDLPIWSSFRIFNPSSYPSKAAQLRGFGNENVTVLLEYFGKAKIFNDIEFKAMIEPLAGNDIKQILNILQRALTLTLQYCI